MMSDSFEKAFAAYLDSEECERGNEWLFRIVREAYTAGWHAAKRDSMRIAARREGGET